MEILTILCLIVSLIAGILVPVLGMFDNALALFAGGSFYELENADKNAIYYELDFDSEGVGSKYRRIEGGLMPVVPETGEVPWNVYTEEVKPSVSGYGDAAIVVLSRTGAEQYDLTCTEYNYLALDENERALLENLCAMKENGKISKIIVLLNAANANIIVDYIMIER